MNVIILTAKFGMGHVNVAKAIQDKILEKNNNVNVSIVDFYEYFDLKQKKDKPYYQDYLDSISKNPKLYNLSNDIDKHIGFSYLRNKDKNNAYRLIKEYNPDLIISTFPWCTVTLSLFKKECKVNIPLYTYVTDIEACQEWVGYKDYNDYYFVGSMETKNDLIKLKVEKEKIIICGIPVRKEFSYVNNMDKEIDILIMGGSMGLLPIKDELIKKLSLKYKITIITGSNKDLYNRLCNELNNVIVLGYVNDIYKYMFKSKMIITKPGGITLFECLNSKLPLYIINPLLSQEIQNAHYIENNNIGKVIWKMNKMNVVNDVNEFMDNVDVMQCNMEKIMKMWKSNNPLDYLKR